MATTPLAADECVDAGTAGCSVGVSARDLGKKGEVFRYGRPKRNDYSEDATLRSIEDSPKRLATDHVDIAFGLTASRKPALVKRPRPNRSSEF